MSDMQKETEKIEYKLLPTVDSPDDLKKLDEAHGKEMGL